MSKRYAIIVGVTEYKDNGLKKLDFTKNDAIRLSEILRDKADFLTEDIHLFVEGDMTNGINAKPPHYADILSTLRSVCSQATDDDIILFFFSGHGLEISDQPYLLAYDSRLNVVDETSLNVNDINKKLEDSKARFVIRFFDACRDPYAFSKGVSKMGSIFSKAILKEATGWATIASCSSGESSFESSDFKQGVFSHYLCNGLEGSAANDHGIVTLGELLKYVRTSVLEWSRLEGAGYSQTPQYTCNVSGDDLCLSKIDLIDENADLSSLAPEIKDDPFIALRNGLKGKLQTVSKDIRQLSFTDETELNAAWPKISELFVGAMESMDIPAISISIKPDAPNEMLKVVQNTNQDIHYNKLIHSLRSAKIESEYVESLAKSVVFVSSETVVPSSTLYFGIVRFKYFYWIWFWHGCNKINVATNFAPAPSNNSGFFALKPRAISNGENTKWCIDKICEHISKNILNWCNQLEEYYEKRLTPVRNMDHVIE